MWDLAGLKVLDFGVFLAIAREIIFLKATLFDLLRGRVLFITVTELDLG